MYGEQTDQKMKANDDDDGRCYINAKKYLGIFSTHIRATMEKILSIEPLDEMLYFLCGTSKKQLQEYQSTDLFKA